MPEAPIDRPSSPSPGPFSWFPHLLGAIAFYTIIPLPASWAVAFQRAACFAPAIGLLIGSILALTDAALAGTNCPIFTRSAILLAVWLGITGGLHLDGAMDTADGLGVSPEKRLQVMADSATGAFGAMAAIIIALLKVAALTDLTHDRWLVLLLVPAWGRWGQQVAIACYPYLKPSGKGAFHKEAVRSLWDTIPSAVLLLGLGSLPLVQANIGLTMILTIGAGAIGASTAAWFAHRLGGHTGDTYGAVVEWSEAFILLLAVGFSNSGK